MTIDFKYSEYCKEADIIFVRKITEVLKNPLSQKLPQGSHQASKTDFADASDKLNI